LTAPAAIVKVDPKYAPEVVREKLEGLVILFAILRKDGTIDGESVRVIRKLDNRLDLSAREALLSWKFKPSQKNGIAVDIQMEVSIPFYFRKEEGL
jgi:TonB family protein